ncbi:helix-turn-helix domain-containing protein [Pseudomonas chlororaphis subsp. aurantiaca]|uniref:helix-turn-helix domain-containing protein n=1 Tax=Pseudomonas chlororaphis TaxID=587753 RepID=UPI0027DD9C6F|nr:helix-turn-helix domain-containing protein [Pseudomonas chlororaphis]WMI99769.1 helix-turn-helix domain-containing protein [Pseudomonas chlororaphis subsp. aurantiaca]
MSGLRDSIWRCVEKFKGSENEFNVTHIARAVGVSRSTLYKYYPDVVAIIRQSRSPSLLKRDTQSTLKLSLLKAKVKDQKTLIDTLSNICSAQLVEILELRASYQDQLELKSLRIKALEAEISKVSKSRVRHIR